MQNDSPQTQLTFKMSHHKAIEGTQVNLNKKPPINLNILTLSFPITAWVSILHRISGLISFLLIPYLLWLLHQSLASIESFQQLSIQYSGGFLKFILWILLSTLTYHVIAGIRHLLLDQHIGETKRGGWFSAVLILGFSIVSVIIYFGMIF